MNNLIEEIKNFYKDVKNVGETFISGNTTIVYEDACALLQAFEIQEQCEEQCDNLHATNYALLQEVKRLNTERTNLFLENEALKHELGEAKCKI